MGNDDTTRDPFELLAEEFTERCRRGEQPAIDDYVCAHPALADEIRALFPTIAALEQLKDSPTTPSDGGPVAGTIPLERLGDYRIIRELGRGGMGIVYEAEQESLGRRVAVKVLPRQILLDSRQLQRFEREARTAARLHHTNIVPIFGVGEHGGYHYIVMQYIRGVGLDVVFRELLFSHDGAGGLNVSPKSDARSTPRDALGVARSLIEAAMSRAATNGGHGSRASSATLTADVLDVRESSSGEQAAVRPASKTRSKLDAKSTAYPRSYWHAFAQVILQAADALAYAHEQGTLHRDIKPSNLLLDRDGVLWVADFGLAKAVEQDGITRPGDVVGTLRYMAPEQLRGQSDPRSDIYSLGLTLYEMLTGQPAFEAAGRTGLVEAIMRGDLARPRLLRPGIPRDLETIVLKCVALHPEDRYRSARALANDLACFLEDRPILARRVGAVEQTWRWARRSPAVATLVGLSAVLLLTVAIVSSVAYFQTRNANQKTQSALKRAESTTELALEALDTIFDQLAPAVGVSSATLTVESADDDEEYTLPAQPMVSEETATLLEHMLTFYRRLAAQEGDDPAIQRRIADASRRVGDIYQRLDDATQAAEAYSKAIELYEQLGRESAGDVDTALAVARIRNDLSTVLARQDKPEESRETLERALETLEPLAEADGAAPAVRYELARTYALLARGPRPLLAEAPGEGPGRGLDHPGPPLDSMRGPAGARRERGPGRGLRGPQGELRLQELMEYRTRAIEILTELIAANPRNPDYRRQLALCYRDLPPTGRPSRSDHDARVEAMSQALEALRALTADFPGVADYENDLAETLMVASAPALAPEPNGQEISDRRIDEALAIADRLVAAHPNIPGYVALQVRIRLGLAARQRARGELDAAARTLDEARKIQASLVTRFPENTTHRVWLAVVDVELARLLNQRGEVAKARDVLETALANLKTVPEDAREGREVRRPFVETYRELAATLHRLGDKKGAEDAERQAEAFRPRDGRRRPPN